MTDCELMGLSSRCGENCPVLRDGDCEMQEEMQGKLDALEGE